MFGSLFDPWYEVLVLILAAVMAAFPLIYGGPPERAAGGGHLVAYIGMIAFQRGADFSAAPYAALMINTTYWVLTAVLSLRYRRAWLVPFSAMQFLSALPSWVMLIDKDLRAMAAISVANFWAYAAGVVLLVGTAAEAHRRPPAPLPRAR